LKIKRVNFSVLIATLLAKKINIKKIIIHTHTHTNILTIKNFNKRFTLTIFASRSVQKFLMNLIFKLFFLPYLKANHQETKTYKWLT